MSARSVRTYPAAGIGEESRNVAAPLHPNQSRTALSREHDPEKWEPVFGRRSCSNKKIERGDDSKKNHPTLRGASASGARAPRAIPMSIATMILLVFWRPVDKLGYCWGRLNLGFLKTSNIIVVMLIGIARGARAPDALAP